MNKKNSIKQVCVYCASSAKIDKKYFEATATMAKELVKENIKVIYGGGSIGLMGALADTVLENGGQIKGIIPKFMMEVEWNHKGVSDMEIVGTMHERKFRFLQNTDALITLPGGSGTFEELLEAITLKRLGKVTIPIIIVNIDGYYDPLLQLFDNAIKENFMAKMHKDLWTVIDDPRDIINVLNTTKPWSANIHDAAV